MFGRVPSWGTKGIFGAGGGTDGRGRVWKDVLFGAIKPGKKRFIGHN